ncbi:hypothetical protein FVA81_04190 [Rhizobium sp. WL3]|uniref:hypothetical protein n=1 Tax=Rhizobium sp. WL3 TaxID=2603277 RepID=UPI0011C1E125|nr:hypothetical protein [Rhizobium sp. WL3]QEE43859.1 hypothetical protein FVA81_04190 [Rhizobium sp. WL3]
MREYLEVWDHVSNKQKKGWQIAALGNATIEAFKTDRYQRWKLLDPKTQIVVSVHYYTPVTTSLQKNAEKLGQYLHSQVRQVPADSDWWITFRSLLDEMVKQLTVATAGTLLGPAMLADGNQVLMSASLPPVYNRKQFIELQQYSIIDVDYLDELPNPIDAKAVIWR